MIEIMRYSLSLFLSLSPCLRLSFFWSPKTYAFFILKRGKTSHAPSNVKYFLKKCGDFVSIRKSFFNANNTEDEFENANIDQILSFLRDIKI